MTDHDKIEAIRKIVAESLKRQPYHKEMREIQKIVEMEDTIAVFGAREV